MLMLAAILVPLVGAVLCAIPRDTVRRVLISLSLICSAAISVAAAVMGAEDKVYTLLEIAPSIVIALRCDSLSVLFALVAGFGWLCIGIYSFRYIVHEGKERRFFAFFLIVEAMFFALLFSANLVTMYAFFELVTITSMPLVMHSGSKESIAAAFKYMFYSIAGAFMALFGIFILSSVCSSLDFTPGGTLDQSLVGSRRSLVLAAVFVAICGFGVKAGLYPLHGWLPTAHPVAPSPASALLSGIIVKAGVLSIIRVLFYIVGGDFIADTWVQYTLLSMALFTVFLGSMMAYREKILKKRLAFSTVSQISYILCGLFSLSTAAVAGGLMHVVFHAFTKMCLFLCAGSIIFVTGNTRVDELNGIGKKMPVTMWAFTLASLALVGIPPASGFVSKWFLATGALDTAGTIFSWLTPTVLLISALLTAGYLLPVSINGFFPGKNYDYSSPKTESPAIMYIPVLILGVASVLLGVFSNEIVELATSLASALM